MDFQDVSHWQNNKVDRTESSRMGWSDISVSLCGPVVSYSYCCGEGIVLVSMEHERGTSS